MGITTDDIVIKASQMLNDDDDGGGYMTSALIVDGAINNLFKDISRLDRAYGRVSLRKFYMHVNTADTSTYSGAHIILSKQADDPNIIVTLFTTKSDSDHRSDAIDRLESYVTLGPSFAGWLFGDHPEGARSLSVFCSVTTEPPEVNDVLCLFNNKDTSTEESQYVRVTDVEVTTGTFTVSSSTFTRKIVTLTISDPLEYTFAGKEIHNNDNTASSIYTTNVSDAAEYFGTMLPTQDIASGDNVIMVDDIYAQLVPTSQTESNLADQTPGEATPISKSGETTTLTVSTFSGTTLYLSTGIFPGSLTLTLGGVEYVDQGDGVLMQSSNQAGTIDYATGTITFLSAKSSVSGTAVFDPGVGLTIVAQTLAIQVPESGQGYSYIGNCWPLPVAGTVTVDYMVDGTWYRLVDDGKGFLNPLIAGTGTGTVNYLTGTVAITCAAIPDSASLILLRWGLGIEVIQLAGNVEIDVDPIKVALEEYPVAPGSIVITWPIGVDETATATDDGNGNIIGDATGTVVYGKGDLEFTPTKIPVADSDISVSYDRYSEVVETASSTTFTLANAPKPGTLSLSVTCTVGGISHTYVMGDDGEGNLYAKGFTQVLSQCRSCETDSSVYAAKSSNGALGDSGNSSSESYVTNDTEKTVTIVAGGITGTIDYVTAVVVLDLTSAVSYTYTITNYAESSTKATGDSVSTDFNDISLSIG